MRVEVSLSRGFAACMYLLVVFLTCTAASRASGSSKIREWVFLSGAGAFRTRRAVEEKHAICLSGAEDKSDCQLRISSLRWSSGILEVSVEDTQTEVPLGCCPAHAVFACCLSLVGCGS